MNGGTPTTDPEFWDGEVPWATPVDLGKNDGSTIAATERTLTPLGVARGSSLTPDGSVLLSCRAPIGYTALTARAMSFNQGCKSIVPLDGVDGRYLQYSLISAKSQVASLGNGSTFLELSSESIASLSILLWPIEEQRRIVDFLDDRVARIDWMIAARQRQTHLIRERFKARREVAVRGLKGTSVPAGTWIGRLSAGWEVRRLGSLVRFYAGSGFPPETQGSTSGDLPFAKVSDMQLADDQRNLTGANNWVSLAQAQQLKAQAAPEHTIIFPKVGAALLTNSRAVLMREMTFDNNVMGINFAGLPCRFWFHVLSVIDMGQLANPGPVPSVNREAVAELRVPFPEVDEQAEIGRSLDHAMLQVEQQARQLHASVRLLTEYKQSLITAAVTGELDVTTAGSGIPG